MRSSAAKKQRVPTTGGAPVDANELFEPVLVSFIRKLIFAANPEQEGIALVIGDERFCLTSTIKDAVCVLTTDNSKQVVSVLRAALAHRRQCHEVTKKLTPGTKGAEHGAAAEDPRVLDEWAAMNVKSASDWASLANTSPILRLKHPTAGLLAVVPAFTARQPIEGEQRKRATDQLATSQAKAAKTTSVPKQRSGAAAASGPPASMAASSAGTASGTERR